VAREAVGCTRWLDGRLQEVEVLSNDSLLPCLPALQELNSMIKWNVLSFDESLTHILSMKPVR
jgi:hypothetical protein